MRNIIKNIILLLMVIFALGGGSANATVQEPDKITLTTDVSTPELQADSTASPPVCHVIVEYPLKPLMLKHFPRSPFDFENTANRKRYSAVWNVRNGKLYLAEFSAKIGGEPVKIDSIIAGGKLPVFANWYTGKIHVLVSPLGIAGVGRHPYYDRVFRKVRVLTVKDGVVIDDVEELDYRILNPAHKSLKSDGPVKNSTKKE